jgi:hypothetical protein
MSITWSVRKHLLLIPFAAAVLAVGCGEGNVLQSPTGPSSTAGSGSFLAGDSADGVVAATASTDESGTLAKGGNGKGNGNDKGNGKSPDDSESGNSGPGNGNKPDSPNGGPGRSQEDRVVGFVSATTGISFTVNGVTVIADADTTIRHGNRTLTMGNIGVGDHVQARGTMTGTTLLAIEIKVQNTNGEDDDDTGVVLEVEGAVAGFTGAATCPATTFTIGTTTIKTSAATVFDDVTCATLANGALVEVNGTRQIDNSILATRVELQSGPNEVRGTVSELTGTATCGTATPALTFKVTPALGTAVTVKTTATTTFTGGTLTCATLANGANVEVEGTTQADLSLTAASVELH